MFGAPGRGWVWRLAVHGWRSYETVGTDRWPVEMDREAELGRLGSTDRQVGKECNMIERPGGL
jgi:hypothetical protein